MTQRKVTTQPGRGLSAASWVWTPLIASIVALVPALPISLALSLAALALALLTRADAPHRRWAIRAVLIWIGIQFIVILIGSLSWQSFQTR